jgi:hypothetical protein
VIRGKWWYGGRGEESERGCYLGCYWYGDGGLSTEWSSCVYGDEWKCIKGGKAAF